MLAYYWAFITYKKLNSSELSKDKIDQSKNVLTDCDCDALIHILRCGQSIERRTLVQSVSLTFRLNLNLLNGVV